MTQTRNKELWAEVERIRREVKPHVGPGGYYSRAGDCVFYMFENVDHTAKRIDSLLTVFLSDDEDARVVGVQLKSIARILLELGEDVRVEITDQDGRTKHHVIKILPLIAHSLQHGKRGGVTEAVRKDTYLTVFQRVPVAGHVEAEQLQEA